MTDEPSSEKIVKHFYNVPESKPATDDLRQVSIMTLNFGVTIISSFESENIDYLCTKAEEMYNKLKEEKNE